MMVKEMYMYITTGDAQDQVYSMQLLNYIRIYMGPLFQVTFLLHLPLLHYSIDFALGSPLARRLHDPLQRLNSLCRIFYRPASVSQ